MSTVHTAMKTIKTFSVELTEREAQKLLAVLDVVSEITDDAYESSLSALEDALNDAGVCVPSAIEVSFEGSYLLVTERSH